MTDTDLTDALREQVADAASARRPLRIVGHDSKAFFGHAVDAEPLELSGHSGIVHYEPTELVITARAGTPVEAVEAALAEHRQMLAFEPPLFSATASIGGAIASGLAGPRRPWGGAPRDLLLGVTLIDGLGRVLRFGGEVMKNVAGYDVARLMAGGLGTLGALLSVSIKVLPAPKVERSLVLSLNRERALQKMRELTRQPAPLSGACHLDENLYLRLSGNESSVQTWAKRIGGDEGAGMAFWQALRDHRHDFFDDSRPLWRLSLPPATAQLACEHTSLMDWAGSQRWVYSESSADEIRDEVAKAGGHAILFRHGSDDTSIFHPLDPVKRRLHERVKAVFDPHRILNPGRLYPGL